MKSNVRNEKNNERALFYRKRGDAEFQKSNWSGAMKYYNRSLCFAKMGSVHMGVAYAKRAQCFFQLKMYEKCLVDMDLARFANYPRQQYALLQMREDECLKLIANGVEPTPTLPRLDFAPDAKFPEMANVLKIIKSNGKWQIAARTDIKVGQIVLVERSFVSTYTESSQKCCICSANFANLVPCNQCSSALMCPECNGSIIHQVECDAQVLFEDNYAPVSDTFRSILLAMTMFDDADELMNFVEPVISGDLAKIPTSITDQNSKYRGFLHLAPMISSTNMKDDSSMAFVNCNSLMGHPIVNEYFHTERHRRFLMHLVFHHLNALKFRGVNSCVVGFENAAESTDYALVLATSFTHSCAPHITLKMMDGYAVLITVLPVKKGQHLKLSFNELILLKEVDDRQREMLEEFEIKCNCRRCKFELQDQNTVLVDQDMLNDLDFQFIAKHLDDSMQNNIDHSDKITARAESFLNKFGHEGWNDFLDVAYMCYYCDLRKRYEFFD